ncbi:MAG TPA: YihY/virulence factor BrkB family protein [Gaiellaceae bacterium]|nr:YihY/virulence factor BrkB family protein [Gaiellaceae bacterium]
MIARKLARVVPDALQRFFTDQCPQQAAAISYRVLFSIAPLAIVLVSIFGIVLRDESVREDVVNEIVDALPVSVAGRHDVETAIKAISSPASAAGLLSLIVFAWAATGMMTAVRRGLEAAMGVTESRPLARGKLIDLALIVATALLVLVSVGITLLGTFLQRTSDRIGAMIGVGSEGLLGSALLRTATVALSILVVLLLYRFVPARGLRVRDGLAGAILTAVLFESIALASGWIYGKTTALSVIYGSLTSALVFLYSVYLYASALLLGAEVAAAWARPPGPAGDPILTQVRRGVLGLFVAQKTEARGEDDTPRPG